MQKAAEQALAQPQKNLRVAYWHGKGTAKDMVKCLAWLILAVKQEDKVAIELKPKAEAKMSLEKIAKAQELSKEMVKKNPKLLRK